MIFELYWKMERRMQRHAKKIAVYRDSSAGEPFRFACRLMGRLFCSASAKMLYSRAVRSDWPTGFTCIICPRYSVSRFGAAKLRFTYLAPRVYSSEIPQVRFAYRAGIAAAYDAAGGIRACAVALFRRAAVRRSARLAIAGRRRLRAMPGVCAARFRTDQ